jgi:hypothetical protein
VGRTLTSAWSPPPQHSPSSACISFTYWLGSSMSPSFPSALQLLILDIFMNSGVKGLTEAFQRNLKIYQVSSKCFAWLLDV